MPRRAWLVDRQRRRRRTARPKLRRHICYFAGHRCLALSVWSGLLRRLSSYLRPQYFSLAALVRVGREALSFLVRWVARFHRLWKPSSNRCVPEQLVSLSILAVLTERISPRALARTQFAGEHVPPLLHTPLVARCRFDLEKDTARMDQPETRPPFHLVLPP